MRLKNINFIFCCVSLNLLCLLIDCVTQRFGSFGFSGNTFFHSRFSKSHFGGVAKLRNGRILTGSACDMSWDAGTIFCWTIFKSYFAKLCAKKLCFNKILTFQFCSDKTNNYSVQGDLIFLLEPLRVVCYIFKTLIKRGCSVYFCYIDSQMQREKIDPYYQLVGQEVFDTLNKEYLS